MSFRARGPQEEISPGLTHAPKLGADPDGLTRAPLALHLVLPEAAAAPVLAGGRTLRPAGFGDELRDGRGRRIDRPQSLLQQDERQVQRTGLARLRVYLAFEQLEDRLGLVSTTSATFWWAMLMREESTCELSLCESRRRAGDRCGLRTRRQLGPRDRAHALALPHEPGCANHQRVRRRASSSSGLIAASFPVHRATSPSISGAN